jgi:hypothetical protein
MGCVAFVSEQDEQHGAGGETEPGSREERKKGNDGHVEQDGHQPFPRCRQCSSDDRLRKRQTVRRNDTVSGLAC